MCNFYIYYKEIIELLDKLIKNNQSIKNPRQLRNLPGIHAVLLLCGLTRISGMKEVFV